MASHDWSAMPRATVPTGRVDAPAAAAGIASSRAGSTAILVETGGPWQGGGCGSSGSFGGGVVVALPALLAAALVRRVARRGARRP